MVVAAKRPRTALMNRIRPPGFSLITERVGKCGQEEGGDGAREETAPRGEPIQAGEQQAGCHPGAQHRIGPAMVAEKPGWSGGEFVFR